MTGVREIHLPSFDSLPTPVVTNQNATAAMSLASMVRSLYCISHRQFTGSSDYGVNPMPQWDGGTGENAYGRRNNSQPIWPRIAETILRVGADPVDFIRAQFHGRDNVRPPAPNQCLGETAIQVWRTFSIDRRPLDECRREIENDRRSFNGVILAYTKNARWPAEKALRLALGDSTVNYATPLFRYCAAVAGGQADFADFYFERALLQLLFKTDAYLEVYGNIIPGTLRLAVNEFREYLGLA